MFPVVERQVPAWAGANAIKMRSATNAPQSFFLTNPPSDRLRTELKSSVRPPDYIPIGAHMTCFMDERLVSGDKRSFTGAEVNQSGAGKGHL